MAAEPASRVFNDISDRAALRALGSSIDPVAAHSALPSIVAMGGCAAAEWVEFDSSWLPAGILDPRHLNLKP